MVVIAGEEYLTVEEAAARLGVKAATLYAYVSRGVLRSYRQGMQRQRLYRRADQDALRPRQPSAGAPAAPHSPVAASSVHREPAPGPRPTPPTGHITAGPRAA